MNDLQQKIFSIFREVKKICDNNNITYFAIGGTLIGAVRHQGFIPWDDDIDIAIPIEQFDYFLECAKNQLPDNLKVFSGDGCRHYQSLFVKVHDISTTFIEPYALKYPDAYKGIFIDIMPISGIPENTKERAAFIKSIVRMSKENFIHRFSFSDMFTVKTKIIWLAYRFLWWYRPYNYYSNKWLTLLKRHPLNESALTGYVWSESVKRIIFDAADFQDTVSLPFESDFISCPAGYDDCLRVQFGDYMQLPPPEQRVSHDTEVVDVDNSYLNYKKESV